MYGIAVHVKRFIPDPGVTEVQSSSWDLAAVGVHVKSGFQIAGLTILLLLHRAWDRPAVSHGEGRVRGDRSSTPRCDSGRWDDGVPV